MKTFLFFTFVQFYRMRNILLHTKVKKPKRNIQHVVLEACGDIIIWRTLLYVRTFLRIFSDCNCFSFSVNAFTMALIFARNTCFVGFDDMAVLLSCFCCSAPTILCCLSSVIREKETAAVVQSGGIRYIFV